MSKLSFWRTICLACVFCGAAAISSRAQTFTSLFSFNGANGAEPVSLENAAVVQGFDGNFYGTTAWGGANDNEACASGGFVGCGTVFKVTPAGTLTTLYSFCAQTNCTDGYRPYAGLMLATNGDFYGTTAGGGAYGFGTVFKITPAGKLTTVHSFDGTDGADPTCGLAQATNGDLYGTTESGGAYGFGTVFKITPAGKLTTVHSFDGSDGRYPWAGLIQATNGSLYGATSAGGADNAGTVFEITTGGTLTTLNSFDGSDGEETGGLVQATDGNFYGTTEAGGVNGVGTVFKITPAGTLTALYSFCAETDCADGEFPDAGLVQATDGNFYGTTAYGGANNDGTVFKITPGGTLTTLHSFDGTDGMYPWAGLLQATNGKFYGTTLEGGTDGDGTVFSLSVGLGPFVETLPTSGKVGAAVVILGNNLTGATNVTFNGTSATFTVVSGSEIKTTVPSGATTGKVKVTVSGHTLTSNVNFRVTPTISSFSPTSGPVGTSVTITGESLTGATSVTFGGVKATSFTVDSYTQITATVPTGAKTGKIGVTTPGGTATSAGTFTVT